MDNDFLEKTELVKAIKQIADEERTGLLAVVTDGKRSLLLRFCDGILIQANARKSDVGDVLFLLNDCQKVKFSFADLEMEPQPSVMPVQQFIDLIISDTSVADSSDSSLPILPDAAVSSSSASVSGLTRNRLTMMLADYIGPAAGLIVEEAFATHKGDMMKILGEIQENIEDREQAEKFKQEVLESRS